MTYFDRSFLHHPCFPFHRLLRVLLLFRSSDDFALKYPEVVLVCDEVTFVDSFRNQAKLASGGVLQFTRWAHASLGESHAHTHMICDCLCQTCVTIFFVIRSRRANGPTKFVLLVGRLMLLPSNVYYTSEQMLCGDGGIPFSCGGTVTTGFGDSRHVGMWDAEKTLLIFAKPPPRISLSSTRRLGVCFEPVHASASFSSQQVIARKYACHLLLRPQHVHLSSVECATPSRAARGSGASACCRQRRYCFGVSTLACVDSNLPGTCFTRLGFARWSWRPGVHSGKGST